jgi:hypothetical protein
MTLGAQSGTQPLCPRCGTTNEAGDNFCGSCSEPLTVGAVTPSQSSDGVTRYLCAAAHLDAAFAKQAIQEYLTEELRSIPPSPGVRAAPILREAVAAHHRRAIRNVSLLLLIIILAIGDATFLIVWAVTALATSLAVNTTEKKSRERPSLRIGIATGAVALLAFVSTVPTLPLALLGLPVDALDPSFSTVILTIAAVVLGTEAHLVNVLVRQRFRQDRFQADSERLPPGWERFIRTLGVHKFERALKRVARADSEQNDGTAADVIVHRGASPFVGAGIELEPQVVALPLEAAPRAQGSATPTEQLKLIDVLELHEHVTNDLETLRSSAALTPGGRLSNLTSRANVLIPADRLISRVGVLPGVLDDLHDAPARSVSPALTTKLARQPEEWARYYRCYRVEAWDGDLAASCYLYAGTDQSMLYLEWTHCMLTPLRETYRMIDQAAPAGHGPLSQTVVRLALLPLQIVQWASSAIRESWRSLLAEEGALSHRLGAGKTLRELAADEDVQTYFQQLDAIRYVKIIDATLFRAVGNYLEQRGYSVVEFQKVASNTINNNSIAVNSGTFIGSAVGAGTVTNSGATRNDSSGGRR